MSFLPGTPRTSSSSSRVLRIPVERRPLGRLRIPRLNDRLPEGELAHRVRHRRHRDQSVPRTSARPKCRRVGSAGQHTVAEREAKKTGRTAPLHSITPPENMTTPIGSLPHHCSSRACSPSALPREPRPGEGCPSRRTEGCGPDAEVHQLPAERGVARASGGCQRAMIPFVHCPLRPSTGDNTSRIRRVSGVDGGTSWPPASGKNNTSTGDKAITFWHRILLEARRRR